MHLQWVRLHADKKTFLWVLFFVQVCLIGGVLFFGVRGNTAEPRTTNNEVNSSDGSGGSHASGVQFVINRNDTSKQKQQDGDSVVRFVTSGQYEHEFVGKRNCFKDGLARRPAQTTTNASAANADERTVLRHRSNSCVCKPDYHGSDCGQPEVIWRAFMAAKMPLKLAAISRSQPHSIFYLIQSATAVSGQIETLEIQIMELAHVVDIFVLCGARSELQRIVRDGPLKPLAQKILILPANDKTAAATAGLSSSNSDGRCSLRHMYARFRQHFATVADNHNTSTTATTSSAVVRTDDVLLVSGPDEILNWRAVKYFKWYDHWPQPVQFRLKYLVYGYYWQHPQSTWLAAGAAQLSVLEEVHRGDPRRLVAATKPGMIVGDLNHVGGWFCQYCYHPLNVVRRLSADRVSVPRRPAAGVAKEAEEEAAAQWSGGRVEQLIANGLFVDGKLGLTRLHRFADKYYAPECVRNASWRYEGVLSNVYATYDDDYAK